MNTEFINTAESNYLTSDTDCEFASIYVTARTVDGEFENANKIATFSKPKKILAGKKTFLTCEIPFGVLIVDGAKQFISFKNGVKKEFATETELLSAAVAYLGFADLGACDWAARCYSTAKNKISMDWLDKKWSTYLVRKSFIKHSGYSANIYYVGNGETKKYIQCVGSDKKEITYNEALTLLSA